TYRERERGLGGSTEGMRQDVEARLRRRPELTPRALAHRAETRLSLSVCTRVPSSRPCVWMRMTRRTRARTTILDRSRLWSLQGVEVQQELEPRGPLAETRVSPRGTRGRWPRRGGTVGAPSWRCRDSALEVEAA